jgi:hypothetical protein
MLEEARRDRQPNRGKQNEAKVKEGRQKEVGN